jgi:hypothetical protein
VLDRDVAEHRGRTIAQNMALSGPAAAACPLSLGRPGTPHGLTYSHISILEGLVPQDYSLLLRHSDENGWLPLYLRSRSAPSCLGRRRGWCCPRVRFRQMERPRAYDTRPGRIDYWVGSILRELLEVRDRRNAGRRCRDAAKIDRNRRATLTRLRRVAGVCQSSLHARVGQPETSVPALAARLGHTLRPHQDLILKRVLIEPATRVPSRPGIVITWVSTARQSTSPSPLTAGATPSTTAAVIAIPA